jgi:hypothetical protein
VAGWTEPSTLVVVTHGANILPLTGVTPERGRHGDRAIRFQQRRETTNSRAHPAVAIRTVSEEIRPACRSLGDRKAPDLIRQESSSRRKERKIRATMRASMAFNLVTQPSTSRQTIFLGAT